MSKVKYKIRIIGSGKKYYLEFLRNLTPQILLFSFVVISGHKLNFTEINSTTILPTLLFVVLLCAFLAAVYSNFSLLFNGCYSDFRRWGDKVFTKSLTLYPTKFSRLRFILHGLFRKKLFVLEMIFVLFFLQIVLAGVIVSAIKSAGAILQVQ